MKNKFFFLCICGFFLTSTSIAFAEINLTVGTCTNFMLYNPNNNSTYQEAFCVGNFTVNENVTLTSVNSSWINQSINLSIYVNFTQINETQQACSINKTLSYGETYQNSTLPCNVTVTAPTTPSNITTISDVITPQENVTWLYNKSFGNVQTNLTIKGYPICTVQIPTGFKLIDETQLTSLQKISDDFGQLQNKTIDTSKELYRTQTKLQNLENQNCNLTEVQLLEGWNKLRFDSKDYLPFFAKLDPNWEIDAAQFSAIVKIKDEDQIFLAQRLDFVLQQYAKNNFADVRCVDVYYPQFQTNLTECHYKPKITPVCIEKIENLKTISEKAQNNGKTSILLIGGVIAAIVGAGMLIYIYLKHKLLPWI